MTGKAVQSKVVQRMLLIALLLAVAHAVKPFSLRNVAFHFVHSVTSFSFVLPGALRGGVEDANRLALALEHGWRPFETRREPKVEADWPIDESNAVAQVASQPESAAACEKRERLPVRHGIQPQRVDSARMNDVRTAAESPAKQSSVEGARESLKGLIVSNTLRLETELQDVRLPDLRSFTPVAIPLPSRSPLSLCESRQLREASQTAMRAVTQVVEAQKAEAAKARAESGEAKAVKAAARQRLAQGFKVLLANASAKRVFVNCSTSFTQSGFQINFKCS